MKETKLTAKMRTAKGKAASGRMRREGWFPAVVYGAGRPGLDVQLNAHDFVMVLRDHHSENLIVDLAVEGQEKPYKVMVKAMQHHPLNGRVLHVDFYEINMSKKIKIRVPVELKGEATGVVNGGGLLEHVLREVNVECLPGDMPEEIAVDVSGMELGSTLHVKDIATDGKFVILDDGELVVAAVAAPRTAEEEEKPAEGEAASPEVITEKKADDDEKAEKEKK